MTKKQEEAIEMLEDIRNNTWTTKYIMSSDSANAEAVLNMLKEKDIEINKYKKKNKELSNQILKLYKEQDNYNARIENKNTEIAKKDKRLTRQSKLLIKKDNELKKKDKIIDLMAEFLGERDLRYYKNETDGEILGIIRKYNKEDWKQYFKRKATNNG